jgi:hypothetical protein
MAIAADTTGVHAEHERTLKVGEGPRRRIRAPDERDMATRG